MKVLRDITGQRFGRLVVLRLSRRRVGNKRWWMTQCDCGKKKSIPDSDLRTPEQETKRVGTRSCGCLRTNPEKSKKRVSIYDRWAVAR